MCLPCFLPEHISCVITVQTVNSATCWLRNQSIIASKGEVCTIDMKSRFEEHRIGRLQVRGTGPKPKKHETMKGWKDRLKYAWRFLFLGARIYKGSKFKFVSLSKLLRAAKCYQYLCQTLILEYDQLKQNHFLKRKYLPSRHGSSLGSGSEVSQS